MARRLRAGWLSVLFLASTVHGYAGISLQWSLDGRPVVSHGMNTAAAATANYSCWQTGASGFGTLAIASNGSYSDSQQMYAVGFVEGYVTAAQIAPQLENMQAFVASRYPNATIFPALQAFYAAHDAWVASMRASNTSAYWRLVGLLEDQLQGMLDGYNAAAAASGGSLPNMTRFQMQFLSTQGDVLDILPAILPALRADWHAMTAAQLMDYVHLTTACSALIKVDGNYSDLWFGHTTWFPFASSSRIYKHFSLALSDASITGKQVSFSSYPGYLYSFDDYYTVWSTQMVVLETTNDIFNASLYAYIVPQALFAWHRVRVATWMATDAPSWATAFTPYNMGAYNNQYDVLNVGAWTAGSELLPDTLWIVEQMPGLIVAADATADLERGYFPSYNVPYFRAIYEYAGYPALVAAHAHEQSAVSGLSYQLAPRAKIFRRDQGSVVDMDSFWALLRYNKYESDPYAMGNPWAAICARGDLSAAPNPAARPDGCIDTKAMAASWWEARRTRVVSGPTTQNGELAPFNWAAFPAVPHSGLPEEYAFVPQDMTYPEWLWRRS